MGEWVRFGLGCGGFSGCRWSCGLVPGQIPWRSWNFSGVSWMFEIKYDAVVDILVIKYPFISSSLVHLEFPFSTRPHLNGPSPCLQLHRSISSMGQSEWTEVNAWLGWPDHFGRYWFYSHMKGYNSGCQHCMI